MKNGTRTSLNLAAPLLAAAFGLGTAVFGTSVTLKVASTNTQAGLVAGMADRARNAGLLPGAHPRIRFLEPGTGRDGRPADYTPFLMLQYALVPTVMVYEKPADTAVWWSGKEPKPLPESLAREWEVVNGGDPGLLVLSRRKDAP